MHIEIGRYREKEQNETVLTNAASTCLPGAVILSSLQLLPILSCAYDGELLRMSKLVAGCYVDE